MVQNCVLRDSADITRALRVELGLDPEMRERDPVWVLAADASGDMLMELMRASASERKPIVAMMTKAPVRLHERALLWVFQPVGTALAAHGGMTLWAGSPGLPLVVTGSDGATSFAVTADGLEERGAVPVSIEASCDQGIERACDRLTQRVLSLGSIRDLRDGPWTGHTRGRSRIH